MSVEAIGARVSEIDLMLKRLTGAADLQSGGFGAVLAATQTSSAAPVTAGGGTTPFGAEIEAAAARHGVDPALLKALIKQESGFDPRARSSAGALGLTQLMPATAASLGVTDPLDPAQAIDGGAKYLAQQLARFGGDERLALAAYNAGPGAVAKFGGVPPYAETQKYVTNVTAMAAQYRASAAPAAPTAPTTPATGITYSTT